MLFAMRQKGINICQHKMLVKLTEVQWKNTGICSENLLFPADVISLKSGDSSGGKRDFNFFLAVKGVM